MEWMTQTYDRKRAEKLEQQLSISNQAASLLLLRGFEDKQSAAQFLEPDLDQLSDPFLLPDMRKAAERLFTALEKGERIHLHGDYDADGITATSLLTDALRTLNADIHPFIAIRGGDEVGMSLAALEEDHLPHEPALIITVDCGTSNVDSIAHAQSRGVDVIVVDHHLPGDEVPECVALLNPMLPDSKYPFPELAAVGVAFQLIRGLDGFLAWKKPDHWPRLPIHTYTDLAALGTIADVVPLLGENRILAKVGLDELARARRPGICALLRTSGVLNDETQLDELRERLTPRLIGYRLTPLLNAAGRMGDANQCVNLLTTGSYREAAGLAKSLDTINTERQLSERKVQVEAMAEAEQLIERGDPLLLVSSKDWHPGVVGIIANRLAEKFQMPAIVTAEDEDGLARGSVRSPEWVDMLGLLSECQELLTTFGGHRVAAGVAFPAENLETLRGCLFKHLPKHCCDDEQDSSLVIDLELKPDDFNEELIRELCQLGPFGPSNVEPVFMIRGVQVMRLRCVPAENLKLRVRAGAITFDAYGPRMADADINVKQLVDLVFVPRFLTLSRRGKVEVIIRDIRPHEV